MQYPENQCILENLSLTIEAAKRAKLHDFIMDLEGGYDTYIGERGTHEELVKLNGIYGILHSMY